MVYVQDISRPDFVFQSVQQFWHNPMCCAGGARSPVADVELKEHPARRPVKCAPHGLYIDCMLVMLWSVELEGGQQGWMLGSLGKRGAFVSSCSCSWSSLLCAWLDPQLLATWGKTNYIYREWWAIKRAEVYHIQVACFYIHKYTFACRRRMKRCKCSCVWQSIL